MQQKYDNAFNFRLGGGGARWGSGGQWEKINMVNFHSFLSEFAKFKEFLSESKLI